MAAIWEKLTDNRPVRVTVAAAKVTYGYVRERLWPVYSTGMVFGTLMLIASMHEKQTLADHFYGHKRTPSTEDVDAASQLMEDELHRAVKTDVYRMPAAQFQAEHKTLQA